MFVRQREGEIKKGRKRESYEFKIVKLIRQRKAIPFYSVYLKHNNRQGM